MKNIKSLLLATTVAAFGLISSASAYDSFGSPRALDARHRSVATPSNDAVDVHAQTTLGNAARSRAMGHPIVAGSSRGDTDTLNMVKNCHLSPKQMGDTPACRSCCAKKSM